MADPQLLALLAELESEWPAVQQLPSLDLWGSYFDCDCLDGVCQHRGDWQWNVRLRLLTGIGKCSTLSKIHLNPLWLLTGCSVREGEALALFSGLQNNPVLQELDLCGYKGFVTTAACRQALAAVVQTSYRSLDFLGLQHVGLGAQGLGDIGAALGRNSGSVLSWLALCGNDIGNAVGAQHLALILANSPTLRTLWIGDIGMDEEGAVLIADALARTTTLTELRIGDAVPRDGPMHIIPLLQALVWPGEADKFWDSPPPGPGPAAFNRSITLLSLDCPGGQEAVEPGLGEALARVLRSNRALNQLWVASFFVTRGLGALRENKTITTLQVRHRLSSEDGDMDPVLLTILRECKSIEELQLEFEKPFGACGFTKELFQGLKSNNTGVKRLRLDGWDGLDDNMFQDLIESMSTNTNLEDISIKGTSWEQQGKGEHLVKAMRDTRVEPQLLALLADLESESPVLQRLPSLDLWGSYFNCTCEDQDQGCHHRGEWQWEVRLRLLIAIGNCRTLRKIRLNPVWRTGYSVRQDEALALFSGLQHNLVLRELDLCGYQGFVTTAACVQALTAVIQTSYRTLEVLDLRYVGLSAEGLGDIATALQRNGTSSVLSRLALCGNQIGNAVGAQHLADILTDSLALRSVSIRNIGMDEEGAVLIAEALAHTSTLTGLRIGDEVPRNSTHAQPAAMHIIPLLQALVWPESSHPTSWGQGTINGKEGGVITRWKDVGHGFLSGLNHKRGGRSLKNDFMDTAAIPLLQAVSVQDPARSHGAQNPPPAPAAAFNQSITLLVLECRGGQQAGEPGLGEALGRVLRSNRALNELWLDSFFVTRGLEALRENSSITKLKVLHSKHADEDDMDPILTEILQECESVRQLQLQFEKPFGPCGFTKAFFKGLHNNRSIKRLVLDGWDGLDDDMFHDLMGCLGLDSNNVLEKVSCKKTSWEREGIARMIDTRLALIRNTRNSRAQKTKSHLRRWPLW